MQFFQAIFWDKAQIFAKTLNRCGRTGTINIITTTRREIFEVNYLTVANAILCPEFRKRLEFV